MRRAAGGDRSFFTTEKWSDTGAFYRLAIDSPLECRWEEQIMETVVTTSAVPAEEKADMEEVLRLIAEGRRVTDPALLKRIHDRAEQVRLAMLEKHGVTNIAVDLIREARDEE
jgi:hypothetical protein